MNSVQHIDHAQTFAQLLHAEMGGVLQAMEGIQNIDPDSDRVLATAADAVGQVVCAVKAREQDLRQELAQRRIQTDEEKRKQRVSVLTEADYFQDLAQRARDLRTESRG